MKSAHFQCRLTGFSDKTCSLNANKIADIEQSEKIDKFGPDFPGMNVNLNAAGSVAKIEKMALAHVAMCGDASGGANDFAFFKVRADLGDVAASCESFPERFDALGTKRVEFFAPQRDQLILFVHPGERMSSGAAK